MNSVNNPTAVLETQSSKQPLISQRLNLAVTDPNRRLKQGIWAYFILLIFEGALRKWFLPGLATPLLIVRDPIAIWLIFVTWKRGLLPFNLYMIGIMLIGVIGIYTATLLGHGSLIVALYGARILLFHFPLIFVIGRIFNRDDVVKMGIATLWITIPMTILIALQFYNPQSAWVNRGVGGDMEGAGFNGGALGFFRPPGTFSFTNGNSIFYGFAASFIFYFWLNTKDVNRLTLIVSTAGLLAAIPLSISRNLFFQVMISAVFAVIAALRKPKYLAGVFVAGIGMLLTLAVLSQTSFFQTATEAFATRFTNASEDEGGLKGALVDRYLGDLIKAVTPPPGMPYFGYGLGMGTNAGSMLLTGKTDFLIAEGEWGRLIGELGLQMGLMVILIRISLTVQIGLFSYRRLAQGDLLPWLLFSFGLLTILQSQWAQPTALGFSTLIAGLLLASFQSPDQAV